MSKYEVSERDIRELSGEFARPYLIGMISALAGTGVETEPAHLGVVMTDAERLEGIRAAIAAYRSCQHQITGAAGFASQ